jgi:hypothetical protein
MVRVSLRIDYSSRPAMKAMQPVVLPFALDLGQCFRFHRLRQTFV